MVICFCIPFFISAKITLFQGKSGLPLETYNSLATVPAGAVELINGNYQSVMLKKTCPFRVFSPIDPKWPMRNPKTITCSEGMRLVVYVMNLKGVPRPSEATDREVIEGLIKDSFLVVAVDFSGGKFKGHLEMQKDITGLFCMFGGSWHAKDFTQNRKNLLEYPGPNAGVSYSEFNYANGSENMKVPVNRAAVYVIPSGYTVKVHDVFRKKIQLNERDSKRLGVTEMDQFIDIVYPKPSQKTSKVPLLLEACADGSGLSVVYSATPVLYSWLFNGYAFASINFISYTTYFTNITALRYLDSQKDQFSLSGKVGFAGISKSGLKVYAESNFKPQKCVVDSLPYGKASNHVDVCMPVVCDYTDVWKKLDVNSTPILLSWCELNDLKDKGDLHRAIYDAYQKAGIGERCLYLPSPLAGHEYDVYHLNEIMNFFDKYCKKK